MRLIPGQKSFCGGGGGFQCLVFGFGFEARGAAARIGDARRAHDVGTHT